MPRPELIGITGPAGSGKDTTGAMLSLLGYRPYSLAHYVRQEILHYAASARAASPKYPVIVLPPELDSCQSEEVLRCFTRLSRISEPKLRQYFLYKKPTPAPVRSLLQWWGTELRRSQNENYWINMLKSTIQYPAVITDIRFPNEALFVTARRPTDSQLWLINNPRVLKINSHSSESHFHRLPIDRIINNDSDHYHLATQIYTAINCS